MLDKVRGIEHSEEDFKNEEETSSGADQPEEKDIEPEGDTSINESQDEVQEEAEPDYKAELEKTKRERDNYKEGLLALKSKKRNLVDEQETEEVETLDVEPDVVRTKVQEVLNEQTEKRALREVISESSQYYMPELVDDNQYKEIISYLPRVIDRSSVEGITRALKIAVNSWKVDKGVTTPAKKDKSGEIATMKSTPSSKTNDNSKPERKRVIPKSSSFSSWYK